MTIVRDFKIEDVQPIDCIFKRQPSIGVPSLKNLVINATITDDNGKIVGYGAVKIFTEAVLILDKSLSKQEKAKAVIEAMQTAILFSKDAGVEQLYAIASDPSFAEVLRHRYGFEECPGALLMLDLTEDGNDG